MWNTKSHWIKLKICRYWSKVIQYDPVTLNPSDTCWEWSNYHLKSLQRLAPHCIYIYHLHSFIVSVKQIKVTGSVHVRQMQRMCTWISRWMKQGCIHSYITHIGTYAGTHTDRQTIATASHVKDEISSQCVSVQMPWELSLLLLLFLLYHSFFPPLLLCVCLMASCVIPSPTAIKGERPVHSCIQPVSWARREEGGREGGRRDGDKMRGEERRGRGRGGRLPPCDE